MSSRILTIVSIVFFCVQGGGWVVKAQPSPIGALSAKRAALTESLPLFAAEQWSQAESVLHRANTQQVGTPQWDYEAAGNLLEVAAIFENQKNGAAAVQIARLSLGHLNLCESRRAELGSLEISAARELMGYVYEHFLDDRSSAELWYAGAVSASDTAKSAARRLATLKRIDAVEARRASLANSR